MHCYLRREIDYIYIDWFSAINNYHNNNIQCLKHHLKDGIGDYILTYVYKEYRHYIRYVSGIPLVWIIAINKNPKINHYSGLFISRELTEPILNVEPLKDVPVIIPDYSSVDVGVGKKWPTKVFAPFVDSTAWPPYSLTDSYTNTTGLYYNLGFIVSKSATICEPTWGTYYTAEAGPLNAQIKAIRNLGGDVCVSFGGAANVPLHVVAPNATALFNQYKAFTVAYGLTRIDFDLEGTWIAAPYNSANVMNSEALKQLQDYYKSIGKTIDIWFTLPILPTGLTPDGINILQLALNAGVEITGVNAMTMDYGDWAAPNPQGQMGAYGIQAITSLQGQLNTLYKGTKSDAELWAMIGTTPMIGQNDVQSEVFTIADATQTLQFAQSKNIGMISMWSANRDFTGQSGITQTNYQFAQTFSPYK